MAYVSQEDKAIIAPTVKAILKKYKLKGSLSIHHHSTLILTLKSGAIDFKDTDVNVYHIDRDFNGIAKKALAELREALKGPNYFDESDSQTDYFHCSHYYDIQIGKWNKPYILENNS